MKRIIKIPIAIIMMLIVVTSSVLTAFAANDGVQGVSYSYAEKGDCTVDYGDSIWVNEYYTYTHRFTVNGRIATCSWSTNNTPSKGTYKNATKYYLSKSAMRAKAFYWLYLDNDATIPSSSAKYDKSSKTYWDDIQSALDDSGNVGGAYAFVHSVIDYLQQGEVNPYCLDDWNDTVKAFAAKTDYYPNVPAEYEIFYFYPEGTASQSLMSWEGAPHGYIKIVKASTNKNLTDGNANYSFKDIEYYVSKSKTDFDTNGSNYLGYIKLNAAGEGHSKDGSRATLRFLPLGTYYVKEGWLPKNCSYKKNDTVYTVNVTSNHTTTQPVVLSVSDEPKTVYGKIEKSSAKPEWTNGKPEYSFKGIRYSFSTSSTDFSPSGSNYIGYVELDENGVGYTSNGSRATLRELGPGTYYVKESVIPAGCKYKMDNTVYTMTFTINNDENHLKVLNVKDEPEGSSSAKIIKKSSMPEISDGNPIYSLEGAEFTVYKTRVDAENGTNAYTTVVTDENGVSSISEIELGTYYVKETKAPYGFELSDEIKELKADELQEEAYEVEFEDKPIITPISVLLKKQAADGDEERGIGGAEYTVNYYNDRYESVEDLAGVTPTRSWVFGTDKNGKIAYDSDYRSSGDELFYDSINNTYGLPLGTVTIQETKAPEKFYLDEQIYLSQITLDGSTNTVMYNYPVSNEESIETVTISGTKTWDDDNNRDGKRPKSVTFELYRDNELFDSYTMSEDTGWQYEFADLEKGYADINIENHFHKYQYEVKEGAVEYYESSTGGMAADPEDKNHLICDFLNHYVPAKVSVDGTKTWKDYENVMGYRPEKIKVYLYRDGTKVDEVETGKDQDWAYSFTNLYQYHDGGKEYTYTIGEEPVPGYTVKVDGYNLKNTLATGSINLIKTDSDDNPMKGVSFRLYTEKGKPVGAISKDNTYKFWELTDDEEKATYVTDDDGTIHIEELPIGKYYFEETETLLGFIPYGEKIPFEIKEDSDETLDVSAEVENAKIVMPETGGSGSLMFYIISITLAGLAVTMLCVKKSKAKRGTLS